MSSTSVNSPSAETKLEVLDLTPRIGSQVEIDVAALLSGRCATEIRDLLERRGVLVFRGLHLDDAQQRAFTRTIGELMPQGDDGLLRITLDKAVNAAAAEYLKGSFYWHIDGATDDAPTRASILNAKRLSATGGQTEFSNSYAAWDELPDTVKKSVADLRVVHSVETAQWLVNPTPSYEELSRWRSHAPKAHPLVWTHKSGRKSLVLGCTASHVEGADTDESRMLLRELTEWATQPCFVYRHEWKVGDLLIWDNTGVMHRVTPYDPESGRLMTRTTIAGEEPLARGHEAGGF
ncbi:taurine catabolism dioxygenase [Methylosinus sp. C49]|uniref:TauD/TfdA dioxygenase family protein n=1 Tax=Methylosinus sp. C49 TaxID=2699395 RepID=UPI0013669868|nr:TauD/TfdA family dioxygenase [Methylosinus sp. C49]BBU63011.1 taurine catabolism dioxygenase [Methylosinus sp. C49]